jgi:hypothetical protein
MDQKVREIKEAVSGISDEQASRQPASGEWCVKEVLSHLSGRETASFLAGLNSFLEEDTPEMDLTPGDPYFSPQREKLSCSELLSKVEEQYSGIGKFLAGLTEEQLARKAHIAFLKETPLGEYPTLAQWASAIMHFHLTEHINQLRNLCK